MKRIAIVGGGISGLSLLHYLKKKYPENNQIALYERREEAGGTICSLKDEGFIFETGPNAFLTNHSTLEFIEEIGMSNEIIYAQEASKRRYIQLDGRLLLLPSDPFGFIQTPLLTASEKMKFLSGLLNKNISTDQSVYNYTSQRFGETITDRFVDPFLTGIYAGDIKRLHMEHAFPKFGKGGKKSILCSFKNGMGSIIRRLNDLYKPLILTNRDIKNLSEISADMIFISTPAYEAARLLKIDELNKIVYSSVVVIGIKIKKKDFKIVPDGFGYLIPSSEGKPILGVLLESNVFPRDVKEDEIVLRIMMGGSHHPEMIQKSEKELIDIAKEELNLTYGLKGEHKAMIKVWSKAIPQYDLDYPKLISAIKDHLKKQPHISLCANYLGGISFNDCIKNARELVNRL